MKQCPHCGIQVGGSGDYCPLCQNALVGQGEAPHWPAPKGISRRKVLLFQLILFLALGAVLVCCVLDFVMLEDPHRHWSIPVLVYVLAGLDLVRVLFRGRYNGPSLSFRVLMGVILLAIYTDWFFHLGGVSIDLIIPALCGASMLLNFLFAFINTRFTANALGTIVGTGSDVCDHVPVPMPERQMRAGRIAIAVRVGETAGALKLYAESDGLNRAVCTVELRG